MKFREYLRKFMILILKKTIVNHLMTIFCNNRFYFRFLYILKFNIFNFEIFSDRNHIKNLFICNAFCKLINLFFCDVVILFCTVFK